MTTQPTLDFVENYVPTSYDNTSTEWQIFGMNGTVFLLIVFGAVILVVAIVLIIVICTYLLNMRISATSSKKKSLKQSKAAEYQLIVLPEEK